MDIGYNYPPPTEIVRLVSDHDMDNVLQINTYTISTGCSIVIVALLISITGLAID